VRPSSGTGRSVAIDIRFHDPHDMVQSIDAAPDDPRNGNREVHGEAEVNRDETDDMAKHEDVVVTFSLELGGEGYENVKSEE
jgi:hypothetical protein